MLHITAADEKRAAFPLESAIDPRFPDDPRILQFRLPGAHSDIGGSYDRGLGYLNLNLAATFLRRAGVRIADPGPEYAPDPASLVVHESRSAAEQAYQAITPWEDVRGVRYHTNPLPEVKTQPPAPMEERSVPASATDQTVASSDDAAAHFGGLRADRPAGEGLKIGGRTADELRADPAQPLDTTMLRAALIEGTYGLAGTNQNLDTYDAADGSVEAATAYAGSLQSALSLYGAIDAGNPLSIATSALDADGFLTLMDRSKDLIISGGLNIYPREVEEALLRHPDVHEGSVVGHPHPEWGEEVVAFVVVRAQPGADALDQTCLEHVARFKRPRVYRFVTSLPKNNYGKVLKTELRGILARDD